jgi:hypothetical protein
VGGGARPPADGGGGPRFGRGSDGREGGSIRPPWRGGVSLGVVVGSTLRVGAFARWAELTAGKEGGGRLSISSSSSGSVIVEDIEGARLKDGIACVFVLVISDTRGVVGEEGFLNGGGGGGIALRSSSALVGESLRSPSFTFSFTDGISTIGGGGILDFEDESS